MTRTGGRNLPSVGPPCRKKTIVRIDSVTHHFKRIVVPSRVRRKWVRSPNGAATVQPRPAAWDQAHTNCLQTGEDRCSKRGSQRRRELRKSPNRAETRQDHGWSRMEAVAGQIGAPRRSMVRSQVRRTQNTDGLRRGERDGRAGRVSTARPASARAARPIDPSRRHHPEVARRAARDASGC